MNYSEGQAVTVDGEPVKIVEVDPAMSPRQYYGVHMGTGTARYFDDEDVEQAADVSLERNEKHDLHMNDDRLFVTERDAQTDDKSRDIGEGARDEYPEDLEDDTPGTTDEYETHADDPDYEDEDEDDEDTEKGSLFVTESDAKKSSKDPYEVEMALRDAKTSISTPRLFDRFVDVHGGIPQSLRTADRSFVMDIREKIFEEAGVTMADVERADLKDVLNEIVRGIHQEMRGIAQRTGATKSDELFATADDVEKKPNSEELATAVGNYLGQKVSLDYDVTPIAGDVVVEFPSGTTEDNVKHVRELLMADFPTVTVQFNGDNSLRLKADSDVEKFAADSVEVLKDYIIQPMEESYREGMEVRDIEEAHHEAGVEFFRMFKVDGGTEKATPYEVFSQREIDRLDDLSLDYDPEFDIPEDVVDEFENEKGGLSRQQREAALARVREQFQERRRMQGEGDGYQEHDPRDRGVPDTMGRSAKGFGPEIPSEEDLRRRDTKELADLLEMYERGHRTSQDDSAKRAYMNGIRRIEAILRERGELSQAVMASEEAEDFVVTAEEVDKMISDEQAPDWIDDSSVADTIENRLSEGKYERAAELMYEYLDKGTDLLEELKFDAHSKASRPTDQVVRNFMMLNLPFPSMHSQTGGYLKEMLEEYAHGEQMEIVGHFASSDDVPDAGVTKESVNLQWVRDDRVAGDVREAVENGRYVHASELLLDHMMYDTDLYDELLDEARRRDPGDLRPQSYVEDWVRDRLRMDPRSSVGRELVQVLENDVYNALQEWRPEEEPMGYETYSDEEADHDSRLSTKAVEKGDRLYFANQEEIPQQYEQEVEFDGEHYYIEVDRRQMMDIARSAIPNSVGNKDIDPYAWLESEKGSESRGIILAEWAWENLSRGRFMDEIDGEHLTVEEAARATIEGEFPDVSRRDQQAGIEELVDYIKYNMDDDPYMMRENPPVTFVTEQAIEKGYEEAYDTVITQVDMGRHIDQIFDDQYIDRHGLPDERETENLARDRFEYDVLPEIKRVLESHGYPEGSRSHRMVVDDLRERFIEEAQERRQSVSRSGRGWSASDEVPVVTEKDAREEGSDEDFRKQVREGGSLTGPQGYTWVIERIDGNLVEIRRLATRNNTRTLSMAEIEAAAGWRPRQIDRKAPVSESDTEKQNPNRVMDRVSDVLQDVGRDVVRQYAEEYNTDRAVQMIINDYSRSIESDMRRDVEEQLEEYVREELEPRPEYHEDPGIPDRRGYHRSDYKLEVATKEDFEQRRDGVAKSFNHGDWSEDRWQVTTPGNAKWFLATTGTFNLWLIEPGGRGDNWKIKVGSESGLGGDNRTVNRSGYDSQKRAELKAQEWILDHPTEEKVDEFVNPY